MVTKTLFNDSFQLAEKALNLRARRHEMLLSNVANSDTPNYKAFDLLVDEALAEEVPGNGHIRLATTDPDHLGVDGRNGSRPKSSLVNLSPQVSLRGDGNTVDMDREMAALADNQLHYKITSQIVAKKFARLSSIIKGAKG